MSKLAAQLFIVLVSTPRADAAITCATGYTAKTGADDLYCAMGAASCQTDATCCTPPTTCMSDAANIACDAGKYNKMDATETGNDAKAACCMNFATCADATCPAGYEADSANSAEKCSGAPATCSTTTGAKPCCKAVATSCREWELGGAKCPFGDYIKEYGKTGISGSGEDCCRSNNKGMCGVHTCPPNYETVAARVDAMASVSSRMCPIVNGDVTCSDAYCCQWESTRCGGTTVTCPENQYQDPDKASVKFGSDKVAKCCSPKAQCKAAAAAGNPGSGTQTSASTAAAAPASLAMASILIYSAAK